MWISPCEHTSTLKKSTYFLFKIVGFIKLTIEDLQYGIMCDILDVGTIRCLRNSHYSKEMCNSLSYIHFINSQIYSPEVIICILWFHSTSKMNFLEQVKKILIKIVSRKWYIKISLSLFLICKEHSKLGIYTQCFGIMALFITVWKYSL